MASDLASQLRAKDRQIKKLTETNSKLLLLIKELREDMAALRSDIRSLKATSKEDKKATIESVQTKMAVKPKKATVTKAAVQTNKRKLEEENTEHPAPKKAGTELVLEAETGMEVENPSAPVNYAAAVRKIPPVIVKGHEQWAQMIEYINGAGICLEKSVMTKEGYRMYPQTADDFRKLTSELEGKKEYHTYSLPNEKLTYAVIKGLPKDSDLSALERELEVMGIDATPKNIYVYEQEATLSIYRKMSQLRMTTRCVIYVCVSQFVYKFVNSSVQVMF